SMLSSALAVEISKGRGRLTFDPGTEWIRDWVIKDPQNLSIALFAAVFAAATPAVVSACAKLADAAMERLRPMSKAFALVSEGTRTVRVEEKGSTEFIELAQSFNRLVETLAATERMEKAFGRYVSGQVLAKIKAQHGQAELKASSREATVFFADIRGFTQLSEKLAPEQVVEFLNRYLARVVAQVDAHVGYLNKFIGDAVVVVFNGPVDQPDHAERAVKCALALQEEVAKINAEGVLPEIGALRIGVGIATGPMVCGNVGGPTQMEYTVIGDTVNLSARLTSLAGPGEVWVSEATARGAAGFKYTLLPEVKLKGKEKPVAPLRAEGAA
ncbi:MAG: cytochrome c, partial [Myxococcaceae bacterium]|nr:cytochrome c [Myxococcaceae bacterium]